MDVASDGIWYAEHDSVDGTHYYSVCSVLFDGQTAHHDVKILVTEEWGKTLILDGGIQSTEFDEAVVHEAIVHPAMITHPDPKEILILGSDDGAVLREVLAYRSVTGVTMAGVDEDFVDICAEYLPEWSEGCLDLPNVEYEFEDSWEYLEDNDKKFDVIFADLSAYDEEDAEVDLREDGLYRLMASRLNENGIVIAHGLDFDVSDPGSYQESKKAIAGVFPIVANYMAHVPSFRSETMFLFASQGPDQTTLSRSDIAVRLAERGANEDRDLAARLRFYDADSHVRMFSLPKNYKIALGEKPAINGHG
ncbi:hypothetical protein [Hoeflea sp. TYP-13]|uniref:spermine/spermidine synthase domain-containing protein n=1 Tax=Hoeflea sp. TYP-13 TaxID=3230023 RepID=UPI0034C62572